MTTCILGIAHCPTTRWLLILYPLLGGFGSNPSPRMFVVEVLHFWNLDQSSASMYETLRPSIDMRRRSAKRVSTGDNFCNYGTLKMMGGGG